MASQSYATKPYAMTGMPPGIPYIVTNEAAERFSFYGMRTILVVFMTQYLMSSSGALDVMSKEEATESFHLFVSAVYFLPFFGAVLADAFIGKYRTIVWLSVVYCFGHLALALDETRLGLMLGLTLISIGSGGIKPCVSAHVGDQFGESNKSLLDKIFGWFYFSVNLGSFFSTLLTPWLLQKYGPSVAFGVPGILMSIATIAFWMGRHKFVHIPAGGIGFVREAFSGEGLSAIIRIVPVYFFVVMFWALYDQTGSTWVLQAEKMDRNIFGIEVLPSQVQAINPLLILIFVPLFGSFIYPQLNRIFRLSSLRKIGLGLFLTALSFLMVAMIEQEIATGVSPHIIWQILAFVVITAAEVMVSVTCLEFSYTQAPNKMKSLIMALYYWSISAGNIVTASVNHFIQNEDGTSKLEGPDYFWFFAALMGITAILFAIVANFIREKTYLQSQVSESDGVTASA